MHEYDLTLKSVLKRQLRGGVLADWTGLHVREWLPTELPDVRNRHLDLLGWTTEGELAHIEIQSRNEPDMARRLAEYRLDILRIHGVFARQLVLYVGKAPLRMEERLDAEDFAFRCTMADIRDLDAAELLKSSLLEDNVMAVLARLGSQAVAVREVLGRIASAPGDQRKQALEELTWLAGLRSIGSIIEREIGKMPVLDDIMDHDLFGPLISRGRQEGRQEGQRDILAGLLTERFGEIPARYLRRLNEMDADGVLALSRRILTAGSVQDVFKKPATGRRP